MKCTGLLKNIIGVAALLATASLPAQTTTPVAATIETIETVTTPPVARPPAPPSTLASEISAQVSEAEKLAEADPDSEPAATAVDLLNQAGEQLRLRDRFTSETRQHEAAVREAPAQLQAVREALANHDDMTTVADDLSTTGSAEAVEQMLAAKRAELVNLQEQLTEVQNEQQRRSTRSEVIPRELTEARQKQSEAALALRAEPGTEDPLVQNARQLLNRARLSAADTQTSALQAEQARYTARDELLPAARQLLTQLTETLQSEIDALETRHADLRRAEATKSASQLQQAARSTGTSHTLVRAVAAENTSITAIMDLGAVVERQETAQERLREIRRETEQTSATYTNLHRKFQTVGYTDALGVLLRRHRKQLPSTRAHREELRQLDERMADLNLQMLEARDMVDELSNPDSIARQHVATTELDLSTTAGRAVRNEISQLLQARRDYLEKVAEGYENLFQTLVELNATEESLVQISNEFKAFIDERIFWLPNTDRLSFENLKTAAQAFTDVFQPSLAINYWSGLRTKAKENPVLFAIALLLLLAVLVMHHRWNRCLRDLLKAASKSRLASFSPLARSLLYAALYVLPAPLILIMVGWPLVRSLQVPLAVSSLAEGLVAGGFVLLAVRFAWIIVRHQGIADVFFVWNEQTLRKLRQLIRVMFWVYVPAVVLLRMWEVADTDAAVEASRLVLVLMLAGAAFLAFQFFWPSRSIFQGSDFYRPDSMRYRLRYVFFLASVGVPVVLIGGALMGYMYSALELAARLNASVWIGLLCLLVSETAFFWILVKRRRLAIDEARKRREAILARQTSDGTGQATAPDLPAAPPEPMLDIAAISKQAGHLLRVLIVAVFLLAMWAIWAEVLPALNYLNSLELWNVSRTVNEVDSATGTIRAVDKLVPVTIVNLLLVGLVGVGLVVALKNIPGLLDISIYQRFAIEAGEKYAFNTLIRYVLIILAAGYVLHLMGLQWKQIQWLLAAVSVGLGFGLQEIFANFVSGVILLFERPIRVGDIVTVGNESGRVLQIRIRATTVRNWDHKILIIPNKDLITSPVLNWTLLDAMQRINMTIKVPHGADLDRAREIILNVTKNCQYVLADPSPLAAIDKPTLEGVDFLLLAHLPNGDHLMDAKQEIVSGIQREFKAADIKLATPCMDMQFMPIKEA